MAKVILINGSPRADQCTATALDEMIKTFNEEGVETELIHIGNKDIRGCAACGYCSTHDGCVFNDIVNEVNAKLEKADGLVVRKARRHHSILRCAQQILQHQRNADSHIHLLEQCARLHCR